MRKPREEVLRRYVEGAIVSAARLWRHWLHRGLSEDEAMKRAIKQALNMIKSTDLSSDEVISTLKRVRRITDELLKLLEEESSLGLK